MTFDVVVDGRPWKVALDAGEPPGLFTVGIKGRTRQFQVVWIDRETLLLVDAGGPGTAREIGVRERPGEWDVVLDGKNFRAAVSVEGRSGPRRRLDSGQASVEGRQTVVAPMPGRIVRVLVEVGERVAARQAVVIVEAMKMENELRSPKDGTVREVAVHEGAAIETGAVLVVIE